MASKPADLSPADKQWLAFREKHDAELQGFQRHATESYAKFQANVNKERAIILAKHKREEEEFLNKAKAALNKGTTKKLGNKTAGSKTGVQSQANRREATAPPKATPAIKKTPAPRSKAPPIPKPASNTTTLVAGSRNKNAAVAIIDLCSDDDDDEIVLVKEKPTLQIAGQEPIAKDPPDLFDKSGNAGTTKAEQFKPPTKPQLYIPNMLPSPQDSPCTPTAQPSTPTTPRIPSFRKPFLPASAIKESIAVVRGVRAGSQTSPSAPTYCASSVSQSQRDTSVASYTSFSSCASRRKRKVVDISSDEESDYAPPSDDEEPESPVLTDEALKNVKKQIARPATKKARLTPPLPPALASKGVYNKGKNVFGFTKLPKPVPKVNSQTAVALPTTPPRAPTRKPQPTTPSTPTPASQKSKVITLKTQIATASRSPRKAKLDATAKITQLSEAELQTQTNIAIEEANEREEAASEAGVFEQVRGGMRTMSITPAPSIASNAVEDVQMLADISDSEITSPKHGPGWNSWTDSRLNGDRYLAKSRAARPVVKDDSDDYNDPDISKDSVVNGIILHDTNREILRLTEEQERLMKSRRTEGGSRARAVSAVEMPEHGVAGRSGWRARKTMR
ncbi:hypothetical protein J4E91_010358 [Alternaria rosae]|nr:hypothetical protein J4E91_010358 [Alternaria rosae]